MIVQMKKGPIPRELCEGNKGECFLVSFDESPTDPAALRYGTVIDGFFDDGDYFTCPLSEIKSWCRIETEMSGRWKIKNKVTRKSVEEITDVNLRQNVSDALIKYASLMDVNELTANGKSKLLDHVTEELRHQLEDVGIHIIRVSWASDIEYPPQVRESINAKIEATQRAMLRENEVAQSKAEAEKARVAAQGEADAQLTKAKAEAESIAIRAKALRDNPQVLMLEAISRWDGKLPTYLGGDSLPAPLMQLKEQK